ncbi:RrF2 family transcriptional regulator [Methylotetracoccus oryzae]|uniref:RrF2 family transcriptional regulator n=1 Tax=Methylotetracoccus oryzae TaxID=1919059 RepID=UPI001118D1AC|nr:Rrf2 family transcriptional regulator [Methylotetracoccus oryzae]
MQLTQFTDYSLRVLIHLARLPTPGVATVSDIARHYAVSRNHLVKVVHNLATHGFIQTTRGKGGGMQLARPARMIGVGEVVRVTEPNMNLVECFDPKLNECRIVRGCYLKAILHEARRSFMQVLDHYTLADAAGVDALVTNESVASSERASEVAGSGGGK